MSESSPFYRPLALAFTALLCFVGVSSELPERPELYSRTPIGTHRLHLTTEAVVTGKGKVDLTICLPYPESNRYQDVMWLEDVPSNLIATFDETGHPYVKFDEQVYAPTGVEISRDFVVTLYNVTFDWSGVTEIYPYDKTHEEYVRYTRRYPCDITDTNAYVAAYSWVVDMAARLRKESADDLSYVRNAFETVASTFTYGDWPGGFTNLIARKQGACGGISMAFVCLLREAGIPAREMVCKRPDQGSHVWTEFYLQNYGWIPADPTFEVRWGANAEHFGARKDDTIVMSYDTGFTVCTVGGRVKRNVFLQNLSWWWYWGWGSKLEETERKATLSTTWESVPGMVTKDGAFVSDDELWRRFNSFGIRPTMGFPFSCNDTNVGTNGIDLWMGTNCSYVKSPLGYALMLDHGDGARTDKHLGFDDDWTVLTVGKLVGVENDSLFCIGSSASGETGVVLASGRTNEVTLSFWKNQSPHEDIITVPVPDSATKYHSYAIRAHGLDVSLFVDGVLAGTGEFPSRPQSNRLQFHSVRGGVAKTGLVEMPGGCIDDWRLYNTLLPDEMITAYADLLLKHDENPAGESVDGNVIPHAWIARNHKGDSSYGDACRQVQPNGYPLWQCYVAGLEPSNAESRLTAFIEMADGRPRVSVRPDLGSARKYTVLGSEDLKNWRETDSAGPFFKVQVELP